MLFRSDPIRDRVSLFHHTTMAEAYAVACTAEENLDIMIKKFRSQKDKAPVERSFKKPRVAPAKPDATARKAFVPTHPLCQVCDRRHGGQCWKLAGKCLKCGSAEHQVKDCPRNFAGAGQRAPARVYHLTREESEAEDALNEGTLLIADYHARVLFDPGATDSFISVEFAEMVKSQCPMVMVDPVEIHTPLGVSSTSSMVPSIPVVIQQHCMPADLYVLEMKDFDVILGMDWLSSYNATLDCSKKKISFLIPDGRKFSFQCPKAGSSKIFISSLETRRLMAKGCYGYL